MLPVEEAQQSILGNTKVLDPVEIPLTEAGGLVLAEDIISPVNLPYFTNSAMDGYAVKSKDTMGAKENSPVTLKVMGVIRAGDYPDFTIRDNVAAKIMTGAPLPNGADAVVMVEYTEEETGIVKVKRSVNQGSHILKSFAISNCLIKVPGEITHIPSGTKVKAHILPIGVIVSTNLFC